MADFRKAIVIGAAIYAIVFWAATVLMPLGEKIMGVLLLILSVCLVFFGAKNWYFKEHKPKSLMDGLMLGIIFFVVGLSMEVLAMVYGLAWGWDKYLAFFMAPSMLINYVLGIIVTIIAAYTITRK